MAQRATIQAVSANQAMHQPETDSAQRCASPASSGTADNSPPRAAIATRISVAVATKWWVGDEQIPSALPRTAGLARMP